MINVVTIYDELPEGLQEVAQASKEVADKNGWSWDVRQLEMGEYTDKRAASDLQRVKILATEAYTLYRDWDVLLRDNFTLPNGPAVCATFDCLQYNHDDTGRWQQLLKYYEAFVVNRPRHFHRTGDMWKCMGRSGLFDGLRTIRGEYKHSQYHKRMNYGSSCK